MGRAGSEAGVASDEATDVLWVEAVDVFGGVDAADDLAVVDVVRSLLLELSLRGVVFVKTHVDVATG